MSVHSLCSVYEALYKLFQKTGTERPYFLEYGLSGQIVDQKCSLLFLCFYSGSVANRYRVVSACDMHRPPTPRPALLRAGRTYGDC